MAMRSGAAAAHWLRRADRLPGRRVMNQVALLVSGKPELRPIDRSFGSAQSFEEPDWRRIPAYREISAADWNSASWQRKHSVKSVCELKNVLGTLLPDDLADSIERDHWRQATMPLLVPPQMLNTMRLDDLWADPVRRYMLPAWSDRVADWPSHPMSSNDSLHERDMWAVEGLTHRYPNKVLVELLSSCPQYCGHCTRMHLVGKDVPQVAKVRFTAVPRDRHREMLDYIRRSPGIRDVVVSGGDVANVPMRQLDAFVSELIDIPNVRDVRLASKALVGLPQHFLQEPVIEGYRRLAARARARGVSLALHTHANHIQQVTPLVAEASRAMRDAGFRDVRNQGVLLQGVNATSEDLFQLCLGLLDHTDIMPYYFYMCDMIPGSEHWRVSLQRAQDLQMSLMGLLPGFATPRIVCDVPLVGKRWVHQAAEYDRVRGISYWAPNVAGAAIAGFKTAQDGASGRAPRGIYYDPIQTLPPEGKAWWRQQAQTRPASTGRA